MKFLKSKKFWLILLTLIVVGVLIYFVFFEKETIDPDVVPQNGQIEEKKDEMKPASQIKSPIINSWHNKDFVINVLDEDLGSGIDYDSCEYKILTYDEKGGEYSTDWRKRKCNYDFGISVGERKMCGFEGRNACWIYVRSKDKNGNRHNPTLENKSIVYLNIDWSNPVIEKVFIADKSENQVYPINIEEEKKYSLKVEVADNLKAIGCNLYINNQDQGIMSALNSECGKECVLSKEFIPKQAGSYQIFAACKDGAGNISKSETIIAKTNLPPEILSCSVHPTSGNISTQFNFSVDTLDPDNDILSFVWDFGDEEFSNSKDAVHYYKNPGIYEPRVIVSDNKGVDDSCFTAWITVVQ